MNEALMEGVEEFAAFLELNKPEDLNPKMAALGLGRLRDIVQALEEQDRATLVSFFESRVELSSGAYRRFLERLPETLLLR